MAEGQAEGTAQCKAVGMVKLPRGLLETRFGRVPKWAQERLVKANVVQIER